MAEAGGNEDQISPLSPTDSYQEEIEQDVNMEEEEEEYPPNKGAKRTRDEGWEKVEVARRAYKPRRTSYAVQDVSITNPTPIVRNRYVVRDNQQLPNERRPPPIIITPVMAQQAVKSVLATIGIHKFMSNNSRQETRLYLETEKHHDKASQLLSKMGIIQFHTFAPRGTKRTKKWVLYGFDLDTYMSEVAIDLQEKLPGYKMIRRLTKTLPNGQREEIDLIQRITEHYVKITDIRKLDAIDHVRFRVSPFKEDGCPVQCRRCQQYGHTMRYCHRRVVCPRCSQQHELAQCPMTGPIKCTVCNKEVHMATARDCPTRVDIMERRAKKNDPIPPPVQPVTSRRRQPSRNVQSGVAFAELLGGSPANQQQQPTAQPVPVTIASNNPVIEQLCARMDQMMGMVTTLLDMISKILARHYD
ncbi:uncharacterized protein [Halyomorpha halys]|uniref:uncharacterized protein n=1 Tax=Halyomorpha halys TaxID=286706 RepID=UPI0034D2B6C0